MGKMTNLAEKFDKAKDEIKDLGTQLVEDYPNSETLVGLASEIKAAVDALEVLSTSLKEAIQSAEADEALYKELSERMSESEIYKKLKPAEREKLAEYLVQSKQPLADAATLTAYVEKSLAQKPTSDLIGMYPKALLIERGKNLDDGSEGFDAYSAGLESVQKEFDADKSKGVKDLTQIWLQKGLEAVAREFYAEALKPSPEEGE